ncbi:MAG: LysM peptidoglycan-binding domain-containing protein [Lachnospiraceae bacterium]|nr:LysM peptidoglycan-binding domain-containing protein [Lachnospiraceae bacterium]
MDLPKNITQIGESDQRCKIYVEDYVISYIKQMNRQADNRNVAVALYGIRKEENDVSYVFFYGAGKVHSIQKEVRHLSQAQNQEIEKLRKRYFAQYQFLGYRMLDGEMVEGFHICEQGTCRYINGYACFYEKNDVMLAYMLDSRKEEVPPESVVQEKYDRVRQRQEERRAQYRGNMAASGENGKKTVFSSLSEQKETQVNAQNTEVGQTSAANERSAHRQGRVVQYRRQSASNKMVKNTSSTLKMMRVAVVGMFLLLCVLGITTLSGAYTMEDIQTAARKLITEFTEQKIPDAESEKEGTGQVNTLVAEDKLTEAIRQENAAGQRPEQSDVTETSESQSAENEQPPVLEQTSDTQQSPVPEQDTDTVQADKPEKATEQESTSTGEQPGSTQEPVQQTSAPVPYTIQKGDTLTAISVRIYGTDAKVKDICELNNIKNPDDIRFGQKILLP